MKKYILSLTTIIILLLSVEGKAQQIHSFWVYGVTGINSNWILNQNAYGNQEFEYATSFNLTGGIGINYFYNRDWGMGGAVHYSTMGQNYSGMQAGGEAKRMVKLNYIEIPLSVMRQLPYMNYPTWITAGPDILVLLNAKQDYNRDGGSPLPNPDGMRVGDITERFKPVDIALSFSANRMVELNYFRSIMFLFTVNTTLGITDINTKEWRIANTHGIYARSQNFYIGAKVGLMFKMHRFSGRRW
jgi:hypothetical protein